MGIADRRWAISCALCCPRASEGRQASRGRFIASRRPFRAKLKLVGFCLLSFHVVLYTAAQTDGEEQHCAHRAPLAAQFAERCPAGNPQRTAAAAAHRAPGFHL